MGKTSYRILGQVFLINGKKTYSEIPGSDSAVHGLLFNARFIQGIFDDRNPQNAGKYDRFGKRFPPGQNTDDLIAALPAWYEKGLRAVTVGLQGGGPVYTYPDLTVIDTRSFSRDGGQLDGAYCDRLERLLDACDRLGMLVIVSLLYQGQVHLLRDGAAVTKAIRTACAYLDGLPYDNVILEIVNEHDVGHFREHPLISSGEGMGFLLRMAREWTHGRFAVGCSGGGGSLDPEVIRNSDVVLVHGNSLRRQEYYEFLRRVRLCAPDKPIVCNEDSPCFSRLAVARATHTSWGYYNNMTKQEPPADWGITAGEDAFFAARLEGMILGRDEGENRYLLQGLEKDSDIEGRRYVRLASLLPEKIDRVEFYEDGTLLDTAFDEPFLLYGVNTWMQKPYVPRPGAGVFRAVVYPRKGEAVPFSVRLQSLTED